MGSGGAALCCALTCFNGAEPRNLLDVVSSVQTKRMIALHNEIVSRAERLAIFGRMPFVNKVAITPPP
jgi:hypothetical protein